MTQVTNAMRFLSPESILAFNIGNEPDSYHYRDNVTLFPSDYWRNGWFEDVAAYAKALTPILTEHFGTTKLIAGGCESTGGLRFLDKSMFNKMLLCPPPLYHLSHAGPACANMLLWRDAQAKRFGAAEPLGQFSSMYTSHFYTRKSTAPNVSHATFLQQDRVSAWT